MIALGQPCTKAAGSEPRGVPPCTLPCSPGPASPGPLQYGLSTVHFLLMLCEHEKKKIRVSLKHMHEHGYEAAGPSDQSHRVGMSGVHDLQDL